MSRLVVLSALILGLYSPLVSAQVDYTAVIEITVRIGKLSENERVARSRVCSRVAYANHSVCRQLSAQNTTSSASVSNAIELPVSATSTSASEAVVAPRVQSTASTSQADKLSLLSLALGINSGDSLAILAHSQLDLTSSDEQQLLLVSRI